MSANNGVHTGPNNLEGLNNGHFPSRRGPRIHELAIDLRLETIVPSHDLSGAWVMVHW
jgi:hypothetical protein